MVKYLFKFCDQEINMSCYLRHISEMLKEAGIEVTKENRKDIDRALHSLVGVKYKNCSSAWRELKQRLQSEEGRKTLVQQLKAL